MPLRIHVTDKFHLADAYPALQLLLTVQCRPDIVRLLVIDEPIDVLATGEALHLTTLVLRNSSFEVIRDANVQTLRPAAQDVDEVSM
jgi:hypothetical protein